MSSRYDLDFPDLRPWNDDATLANEDDQHSLSTNEELLERVEPDLVISVDTKAGARSYTLLVPLKVNGKWLRQISLRLPSQGDIDDYINDDNRSRREFLARMAGLDPLVIKALRWPDSEAVHQLFHDMVPQFIGEV